MMNSVRLSKRQERASGVELLKVLGIFLVVINHVTQTLKAENPYVPYHDYFLGNLVGPTHDSTQLLLFVLGFSGAIANNIFFFSSAWFLLDKKQGSNGKIPRFLADVWTVSVLILLIAALWTRGNLDSSLVFRQFFPVTFQNNWYITCYILFLPLYPVFNHIIGRMNRKALLHAILFLLFLYAIVRGTMLMWVIFYFMTAYVKFYLKEFSSDVRRNLLLFLFSLAALVVSVVICNELGLRFPALSPVFVYLRAMYNPLVVLLVISLLHIALRLPLRSKAVNYISSLSLFIYLIHENSLVRTYLRPWIWQKIYIGGGYSHLILWIFAYSVALFLCSFAASVFYTTVIQKTVWRISDALFARVFRLWEKLETRLLSLH